MTFPRLLLAILIGFIWCAVINIHLDRYDFAIAFAALAVLILAIHKLYLDDTQV
jgi:hypothetical protein